MAGETEDPAEAAARLEAALERIARAAQARDAARPADPAQASLEVISRLDALIGELRAALGVRPG